MLPHSVPLVELIISTQVIC